MNPPTRTSTHPAPVLPELETARIGLIGAGNMGRALLQGLLRCGVPPAHLAVADPEPAARERCTADGVMTAGDGAAILTGLDVVILCFKPQDAADALHRLAPALGPDLLLVSIIAGLSVDQIRAQSGHPGGIVRTMPNLPALIGQGATALYAGPETTHAQCLRAAAIMNVLGPVVWLDDESLMDLVTAVSGTGPAYFYLLAEALTAAATAGGLDPAAAHRLVLQTGLGAMQLALARDEPPAALRRRVTSPGGTTAAAMTVLDGPFQDLLARAVEAATLRSRQLGAAPAATGSPAA